MSYQGPIVVTTAWRRRSRRFAEDKKGYPGPKISALDFLGDCPECISALISKDRDRCVIRKIMIRFFMAIFILFLSGIPTKADETHQRIERPVRESINIRQATQKAEEGWRVEREKLVARFEQLQKEQELLKNRKAELHRQVEAARPRLAGKEKQLVDIEQISSQIRPFLDELINELKFRPAEGLPFLTAERRERIHKLESIMADPDITLSEKYRKAMEALLVEAEYGFTIEFTRNHAVEA
jgi:hypothetical protein